ncbi:hypothetical protein JJJ17_20140 [Paracoccus caeni]|uniref:ATP-grasp domain-containing protein n=1 Tax=Paracoccus caeni TaxID=657651 RepID=A0A934SIR1_9RHOB|nr:hypothetical protein [Paracoccus caeni]MBK4218244.1 hypothetical protein [Paracoccus caeni]
MSDEGEDQHIWQTSVSEWPQAIRDLCLSISEIDVVPADAALMVLLSAGERGEARARRLAFSDEFRSDLDAILNRYHDGAHIRLNLCSFKRGSHAPKIQDAAGFEVILGRQNYRVYSVLKATLDRHEDIQLFAFPWRYIPPWSEFRMFIRDRRVIGVSQYHHQSGFPEISANEHAIKASLSDFCSDLLNALHMETVVADVFVESQQNGRFSTTLIELNPFIQRTDPCLYTWKNGGDFDGGFRYYEAPGHPHAVLTGRQQLIDDPWRLPS